MKIRFVIAVILLFIATAYADSAIGVYSASPTGLKIFVIDLTISLVIELAVSFIYISMRKLPRKILISVVVANLISVTILQLWPPAREIGDLFLPEILVVIFESIVIFLMNRKEIGMRDAFVMSFFNNSASFIAGTIIVELFFMEIRYYNVISFPVGFASETNKLEAGTSQLYIEIDQETGHPIRVNGINCTQEKDTTKITSGAYISYKNYNIGNGRDSIIMSSGSKVVLADAMNMSGSDYPAAANNIICSLANGSTPGDTGIGSMYDGKIYINYTELDTDLQRIVVGSYTAHYET